MKFAAIAALGTAAVVSAAPAVKNPWKRQSSNSTGPTDADILQYALTLEHLEDSFYQQVLSTFSESDFASAGMPDWVRGRMSQISQHEHTHVSLLTAALGNSSNAACTYAFPLTTVESALGFAAFVENLGVAAYSGANQYISDPLYRTVAAVILSVEGRHQGFWNGPVMLDNDWTGPFDTPLGLDMVYTLAAQVITGCPASNMALPVTAATPLLCNGAPYFAANAGDSITLTWANMSSSGNVNAFIYNGLGAAMVPVSSSGSVTLPSGIQGYSYILISSAGSVADVSTANTIAGPASINTAFNAFQSNPGFMNPYNS